MKTVSIFYQRPSKGQTIYVEDYAFEDEYCLRTFKTLPPEISEHLSTALLKQGLIHADQRVLTIAKVYFFNEPFNILEFRDTEGKLLGHYSDIGEPARMMRTGECEMVDLFLGIWLLPDGTLLELDWDEFNDAVEKNIITTTQANLARAAMQRLKDEVASKIYPGKYLR